MNNDHFEYTYSAKAQQEIRAIRQKYMPAEPPQEDKLGRLRRLDRAASNKATVAALVTGIVGVLVMGCGMSLVMTDIGALFGLTQAQALLPGIGIGVAGMVPVCLAYPVYNRTLKRQRARIAPEILRLSEELME